MDASADDRSLSDLLSDVTSEVATLFREEVELARVETSQQVSKAAKAGAMLGAAGVVGFLTLILLAFAAAWGLAAIMPNGLAFLIVGVVFGLVAAALASTGKKKLASVKPVPDQTLKTVKDDVQVAKDSFARGVR